MALDNANPADAGQTSDINAMLNSSPISVEPPAAVVPPAASSTPQAPDAPGAPTAAPATPAPASGSASATSSTPGAPPAPPTLPTPPATPGPDTQKIVSDTVRSVLESVLPKPAVPAQPQWKPFQVDKTFVDSLIEDSDKGAAKINQMINGVINSTLELVVPFVNQITQPLIERGLQADTESAKKEFAKLHTDLSSDGDLSWAEEVARKMLGAGQRFASNKEFFDAVAKETRSLKEEYRRRLGANAPAPNVNAPVPSSGTGGPTPRGSKMSLNDEQKEMLTLQGIDPNRV